MAKKQGMKQISASIPGRVFEKLSERAEYEGRSFSNLIAYILERSLEDIGEPPNKTETSFAANSNQ